MERLKNKKECKFRGAPRENSVCLDCICAFKMAGVWWCALDIDLEPYILAKKSGPLMKGGD